MHTCVVPFTTCSGTLLINLISSRRLLVDAKFLHKELSGLKNVLAPMGMLETVVSEKQVPRSNVSSPVPAPLPTPTRANTLTANQRLKGLLSRSNTSSNRTVEKALPTPNQTPSSPRTSTSTPPPPPLPAKSPMGSTTFLQSAFASSSTLALSSETASMSNPELNVLASPIPDRIFSTSPPPIGGTEPNEDKPIGAPQPLQQNGHEGVKTPIGSTWTQSVEVPLPEIPHTEAEPDAKV